MAWWQKKLLRYALSRTGLLDDKALDLDNLDIALGKRNVIELKDVGLNIERLTKLAQLPPSLRIETARILSLRLIVPADIYQSGIVAEVDGVDLRLKLEENDEDVSQQRKGRARSPVASRAPSHRKAHRRLHSPAALGSDRYPAYNDTYIPTTEELARSFLLEEPIHQRRQLEASVAAGDKGLEESVVSESSSDASDLGTGATIGLPGFLASFLQGIVDRFKVTIRNVDAKLDTEVSGDGQATVPVTLRLQVGRAELVSLAPKDHDRQNDSGHSPSDKQIMFSDLSLYLISDATVFSELSELPSPSSPAESRQRVSSPELTRISESRQSTLSSANPITSSAQELLGSVAADSGSRAAPKSPDAMQASILTVDADRFADAGDDETQLPSARTDLEIRPGDDNISWSSRRNQSNTPADDLWNSMASEDMLPESLLLPPLPRIAPRQSTLDTAATAPSTASLDDPIPYGPGSWPRLEESPHRRRYQQGPGSWPTMDQSQQSLFQPLRPAPSLPFNEAVDNKKAALEASVVDPEGWSTPPEPSHEEQDDLATSRLFTHEEAQSMYMSAMGQSSSIHVPGGWDDPSEDFPPPDDIEEQTKSLATEPLNPRQVSYDDDDLAFGEEPYSTPGNITPRAASPQPSKELKISPPEDMTKVSRQLLHVDTMSIYIPLKGEGADGGESETIRESTPSATRLQHDMPGTFSAYSEMSTSRRTALEFSQPHGGGTTLPPKGSRGVTGTISPVTLDIGIAQGQLDMSCGRLLYRVISKATTVFGTSSDTSSNLAKGGDPELTYITASIQDLCFAFKESTAKPLDAKSHTEPIDSLITLSCRHIEFSRNHTRTDLRIGSFITFIGSSCLLSFNRSVEMNSSVTVDGNTPDVTIVLSSRLSKFKYPIQDITMEILPLDIGIDLVRIEETFSPFGGLSGMLEVGNSMLSESRMMSSPSSSIKAPKGVRFEGDPHIASSELKINARIGAIRATLRGSACSIELQTTTVKSVYRENGLIANTDHLYLTGPYLTDKATSPVVVQVHTLRLDFLFTPEHKDLERLLSLLTPSRDKYDNDDDILLDTLFRQRNKGSVLRFSVAQARCKCSDWEWISTLSTLGRELSKLSVVTKYLPEDERPGILSLIRIKDTEVQLPVNERFGTLKVDVSDFHAAHVALPALLALSIGDIKALQRGQGELVHPLVQLSGSETAPMVMARMLGDEVEPTIKVKLYNTCFEYSVSVMLGLSGLESDVDTEEMVAELARSVASIGKHYEMTVPNRVGSASDISDVSKKLKLDLIIHDSAIGLSPLSTSSKGLLVLTDARFSTVVPPEDTVLAKLVLRKAGLFIADEVFPNSIDMPLTSRGAPTNTTTKPRLTLYLSKLGFVSVGSIMTADLAVRISESSDARSKTVEMNVRNELLLLETCADSTQTLIAILSGLAPPKPPSKQPKYLTQPMTIEDMMASFTGEAFEKPKKQPVTLFDVEEEPEEDPDFMSSVPTFHDDDDGLLEESEMMSSLYGPISGVIDHADTLEDEEDERAFSETVESLLDDDPFEMAILPDETKMSDAALMRELNKQRKPAITDRPVDLGLHEVEGLGFDILGGNQRSQGTQFRFDRPKTGRQRTTRKEHQELPFRLTLRDFHIIWNIYDGYDWQRTREGITHVVEQVEMKADERKSRRRQAATAREDEESVIGDFLFNSIYIGVPSNQDAQELRRQINRNIDDLASETESMPVSGISKPTTAFSTTGRPIHQRPRRRLKLERSRSHKIAFEIKGVSADILVFAEDSADLVSSVDVRVRDFEIFDHVPTSTWRKFLTHMSNEPGMREMSKPMLHIELLNVRTLENFAASEIVMHVSVLPLRLHVDQDALDFITRFFEFKDESTAASAQPGEQPFLQRVEVDTVDLRLDYKPKKVDYAGLRSGHTTEFMNFIILEAADIRLKHAIIYGIKGFEPLHKTLNDIWMPDVQRNQLPTVLSGLAPVRSLVNIGTGVRDIIAIPVREYKKDGRVVRSIQKGAFQFGKTTASELARLGGKVAMGTQTWLRGAEGFLTPSSTSPGRPSPARRHSADQPWHDIGTNDEEHEPRAISAYANQPLGVLSGLRSARRYLEYDLLTARDALIAVQGEILDSSGPTGAAAAVAKHAPTVILRPIIGTSRALGTALLGVGNQIDRDNARRIEDKYKRR